MQAYAIRTLPAAFAVVWSLWPGGDVLADTVGFKFTGSVLAPAELFGANIPAITPLSGHAIYDTGAQPSHPQVGCTDCSGYQQDFINGFYFEVGPLTIRSDSYVAAAINDAPGANEGFTNDVLSFQYSGGSAPALSSPLRVNGANIADAGVRLSLVGLPTVLFDSQLPPDPSDSLFIPPLSTLTVSEAGNFAIDLLVVLDSIIRFEVIPGDFNQDEVVDEADRLRWEAAYGSTTDLFADGNRDGKVDAADYTVWRDNLPIASRSVPEPAAALHLLFACVAWLVRRRAFAMLN